MQAFLAESHRKLGQIKANLAHVIRGKQEAVDALTVALIAGGSVLIEDVPGVGKTTLAKSLARTIDCTFKRVQFTPDLLPSDILGSSVYNPVLGTFDFRGGPIFCNVLLADEINRSSPRTQSALLEAMNESQVTIDGQCFPLPKPFLVLATENPIEFHGTYPLPEAQLDRFLMQFSMGYPATDAEVDILYSQAVQHPLHSLLPVVGKEEVVQMQQTARSVKVDASITRYIVEIVRMTREDPRLRLGVSTRGSQMLFLACQAAAFCDGRDFVLPDDVQRMAPYVLVHRLLLTPRSKRSGVKSEDLVREILDRVKVPT
jgi:MoxR-like ATPase